MGDLMIPAWFTPLPEIPPVDVVGYRPATSRVYKCPIHGIVWAKPGVPPCDCEALLDADP
jgi:hypothetical protein